MQPIVLTEDGVVRFRANKIIEWLFETGRLNLNDVARLPFEADDRMQIAMQLGYSVSGFGDLNYAATEVVSEADAIADGLRAPPPLAGE